MSESGIVIDEISETPLSLQNPKINSNNEKLKRIIENNPKISNDQSL